MSPHAWAWYPGPSWTMFVYPDPVNHPVVTNWYWESVLCTQIFCGAAPASTIFAQAASQRHKYPRNAP